MKKTLSLLLLSLTMGFSFAQITDTGFSDAVDATTKADLDISKLRIDYKPVDVSCDKLSDYVTNLAKNQQTYYPGVMYAEDAKVSNESSFSATYSNSAKVVSAPAKAGTSIGDNSDVNSQILGVNESDILRSNGKYMFWYNQKTRQVQIISIPLGNEKPKLTNNIKMPEGFEGALLQIYNNKLIILTSKYNYNYYYDKSNVAAIQDDTKTYIAIYDISDISNIKFEKILSYNGYMGENRMIGGKLYLTTSTSISYDRLASLKKKIDAGSGVKDEIIKNLSGYCNGGYIYSTGASSSILSLISVDLESNYTSNIKNIVGGDANNFFMSADYIYLLSPVYINQSNFSCPINAKCMNPMIYMPSMVYTNIVKLSLNDWSYQGNNLATGYIYNPYNLGEYDGGVVAVSQLYNPKTNQPDSSVTKFDNNMNVVKTIESVMPNENLKSVRFIGDKLYIVTYIQTDPLFVIDLKDLKVLGELVIPGFSTYLHPYSTVGNKQYLIGLGSQVDTGTNRVIGIKLDLYEIDFTNTKPTIKQKYTKTIGGKGSYSEALDNPRMFVRDAMRQKLLIPIRREEYNCNQNGCNNYVLFDGFKSIGIYLDKGIIQHSATDYQKYNSNDGYYGYARVGYSSDTIYYINPGFVDFLRKGTLRLDVNK